jgi:hypothetical protein
MKLCDKELGRTYREFNRRWFNDELPHDVDVFFSPAEDCYGQVQEEDGGWTLQINPKYAVESRMWKLVLLHEMVHLQVRPYKRHGVVFQEAMQALARLGAFERLW